MPLNGQAVSLSEVPDEVFASGALGQGGAIKPSDGKVYAPFDGEITAQFPTKHAVGLISTEGLEILIHCGLDTVSLDGDGFVLHVEEGQKVKTGDLLLTMDLDVVEENELDTITPVIITNTDTHNQIDLVAQGDVEVGEEFITIQ